MPDARRVFVDTNVLLYFVERNDTFRQARASEWLDYLWASGAGVLSWQVLHEFYVNAVRKLGVPAEEARFLVDSLVTWRPIDTSPALLHRAWHWADAAQVHYWDSLIVAAAELGDCSILLSEDFQSDRRFGDIQVINPFTTGPIS